MAKFKRSSVASTLSLTPLIDVVFLLLIFFLVTSEFEEEERRLDIVLPSATSAVPMTSKPREVVVDIDASGFDLPFRATHQLWTNCSDC